MRAALAAILSVASLVGAGLWVEFGGASAASSSPDLIVYNQQNGKNGTYLRYIDGATGAATTQPVTGGGGCATPNTKNPVLDFSAVYYANGYGSPATENAIVGTFNNRTGVCYTPQSWSIEYGESVRFAPGSTNSSTQGRLFTRAQIPVEREDKGTTDIVATLVEKLNGATVGSVSAPLAPGGSTVMLDTASGSTTPNGFDTVEVQMPTPGSGSISVIGPTSAQPAPKFTLATRLCPGQSLNASSSDESVTATFTYDPTQTAACKQVTSYSASSTDFTDSPSTGKAITFNSGDVLDGHVTAQFDWGNFPYCRADGEPNAGAPSCPTTLVDFHDGQGPQPETYCVDAPASPTTPWCVTDRDISYVSGGTDSSGAPIVLAHIKETWKGFGDPGFTFR